MAPLAACANVNGNLAKRIEPTSAHGNPRGKSSTRQSVGQGGFDDLSRSETLSVLRDVASGLAYLHANGLHHGDVNAANVLLHADAAGRKRALLCDFGSARTDGLAGESTTQYNAPELFGGLADGKKADAYSFGLLVWEAWRAARAASGSAGPRISLLCPVRKREARRGLSAVPAVSARSRRVAYKEDAVTNFGPVFQNRVRNGKRPTLEDLDESPRGRTEFGPPPKGLEALIESLWAAECAAPRAAARVRAAWPHQHARTPAG